MVRAMTNTTQTTRALIYCRVSEDRRHGRSVSQQETECRAECGDAGWTVVDVVTDNDVGASRYSKGTRPGWARVLDLVETGAVDVLVTWEGSRAQRDLTSYAALRGLCERTGVRWRYGGRTYDLSDWRDRRDTGRDAVDDEAESGRTSERIRRDVRASALAGRPTGRRLFGFRRVYDPDTGALVGQEPHPEEAPIVRRVFAEYLAGASARSIARALNAEGILRPETGSTNGRGKVRAVWRDEQIRRVLTNRAYIAERVHRGEVVSDATWPALIDRETFARVQARLEGRRGIQQTKVARLLTGVARCGVCGGGLQVIKDRNGRRVYWCRTAYHVTRDERRLDAWVVVAVLDRLKRSDVSDALDGTPDPRASEARARADELRARLDAAIQEFSAGQLSAATLAKIEQDLGAKIDQADREARAATLPLDIEVPADVDAWWNGLDRGQQREIVGALVAAVVVKRAGKGRRNYDMGAVTDLEWRH
jgi:site-specific DNA recombinase